MGVSLRLNEGNAEEKTDEEGKIPYLHFLGSWPIPFAQDSGGVQAVSRHTWLTSDGLLGSSLDKVRWFRATEMPLPFPASAFCLLFLTSE